VTPPQTPLGELTALSQSPSWIQGTLLLRGGERTEGKERKGEGERRGMATTRERTKTGRRERGKWGKVEGVRVGGSLPRGAEGDRRP